MSTRWLAVILAGLVAGCIIVAAVTFGRHSSPSPTTTTTTLARTRPLPTDRPPAAGSRPVRQQLSAGCTKAVAPLRALAAKHPSALALDAKDSAALTDGLAKARAGCGAEYQRFYSLELHGWLSPGQ